MFARPPQRVVDKAGHYSFWVLMTALAADAVLDIAPEQTTSTLYLVVGTIAICACIALFGIGATD
ncbi:hypothetical protein [Natronorubrum sp. DTA28]|uniref:hypothetical protein n=1 Tax=Natronorubrum sp. DTA28 TaxID=3447019 RepID=UPI003F87A4C7